MSLFEILGVILMGCIGLVFLLFGVIIWWGSVLFAGNSGSGEHIFAIIMVIIGVAFEYYVFSHMHIVVGVTG